MSDDDDWFNKDEDELVEDMKNKAILAENKKYGHETEYITGPKATDEFLQQKRLEAAANKLANSKTGKGTAKLSTAELRKISQMQPLDVFLHAWTYEPNFFVDQISLNDAQERVLLYLRILLIICELKLPGFDRELLQHFIANEALLEQLHIVAAKLFLKRFQSMWTDDERVVEVVHALGTLLLRSYNFQLLTPKAFELVQHIKQLMQGKDVSVIVQRNACKQFAAQLEHILPEKSTENEQKTAVQQIFPTLNELLANNFAVSDDNLSDVVDEAASTEDVNSYENVLKYIETQRNTLREDFLRPLHVCVSVLKQFKSFSSLLHPPQLFDDVQLVLNTDFANATRHEMLFVDVIGSRRMKDDQSIKQPFNREIGKKLNAIKSGALLCLTTSTDFDNLILATVTYTDVNFQRLGYIGVEIVRQYNIGKVYDTSFLMFETPEFFEPYHNVYNYLSSCEVAAFPMERYIVYGETNVHAPQYLKKNIKYVYERESFNPLEATSAPKNLPLNQSQKSAYAQALSKEFCLIQGPPGTGKTHLSVHLVRTLIENAPKPIVLITYTNESLDKFLLKLCKYTEKIVRFGSQSRQPEIAKFNVQNDSNKNVVNPKLKRLYYAVNGELKENFTILQQLHEEFDGSEESYEAILAAQSKVRSIIEKLNCIRIMFQYYGACETSVIAMTTTFAARTNFLFRLLQTKIVVFEEAAEILESHVLACLTPYTQHVISIGDHMQLRPSTISTYRYSSGHRAGVSLFERLLKSQLQPEVLKIQYRMHPHIAELICPAIYKELKNAEIVEKYANVCKMKKNVYFLSHEQQETKSADESSICNTFEAKQICDLAIYLISKAEYTPADIVILSPYAKQIANIKKKLQECVLTQNLTATTVDSYQGLEANIVLLSLVRSNDNRQIGFLSEKNRVCVALSRAKYGLYMIGNMKLLTSCSKIWRDIKQTLTAREATGDNFPYDDTEEMQK